MPKWREYIGGLTTVNRRILNNETTYFCHATLQMDGLDKQDAIMDAAGL